MATVAARSLFIVLRLSISGTKLGDALPAEALAHTLLARPLGAPVCPLRTQFSCASGHLLVVVMAFIAFDLFLFVLHESRFLS